MRYRTQGDAGVMDRKGPTAPVGERLADRIFALARQVAALHPPGRTDPERFWRDKSELAAQLAEVGREAGRRLG